MTDTALTASTAAMVPTLKLNSVEGNNSASVQCRHFRPLRTRTEFTERRTTAGFHWRLTAEACGLTKAIQAPFATNTFWAIVGSASSQISALGVAILLGRLLGVESFGKLALIQSTVLIASTIGELGLGPTTTKFVAKWRATDPARAGRLISFSLRLAFLTALLVSAVLWLFSGRVPGLSEVKLELQIASVLLLSEILNRVQISALTGLESFRSTAKVYLWRALILPPAVWVGARYGELAGAVVALGFVSAVVCIIGHRTIRNRCEDIGIPISSGRLPGASNLLATSACLWFSTLMMHGSTWLGCLLLAQQPSGLAELGLFHASEKFRAALLFLPHMLFQVMLPMLSHSHSIGDQHTCARTVRTALLSSLALTGSLATALACLAQPVMTLYGTAYVQGSPVLIVAALGSVAAGVYTVGAGALWALGRPVQMISIDLVRNLVFLGLCFAGFSSTARDLTVAYLISFVIGSTVLLPVLRRKLVQIN